MIYSHIVACSLDNGIGIKGKLPWNLKEDLKHFKSLTSFHPIIVGHNTFLSIGRLLPNRLSIVISRDPFIQSQSDLTKNILVYSDLSTCIGELEKKQESLISHPFWNDEVFIIGGAKIYKQSLDLGIVSKIYLTSIHVNIDTDTFYPKIEDSQFSQVERSELKIENDYQFEYITYERKI